MEGLSLIEIIVVLLLLSILLITVIPLSNGFLNQNQLSIRKNEIITAIHYARNQALSRNQELLLISKSGNSDWSRGMLLIQDINRTGSYSEGDKVLHSWKWHGNAITVSWNGFYSDHYIKFSPEIKSLTANGYFSLVDKNKQVTEKITLNRFARIRA